MWHIIYVLLTLYLYFSINVYTSILSYINMSILTQPLSPSFLHARQKLCIQQNTAKLPRSKDDLHSGAARERGRTFFRGVANNTPCYGCCTLSGLPSESKARSFSQKLNVARASQIEWGLLSASATWSIRPLGKSTASYIFVYIYIDVLAYYCIVVYLYCHITLYIYCLQ